jgi:Flp pilus assembly pilin Flp
LLSSTNQAGPKDTNDRPSHWRPTVSQTASAARMGFAPLTIEEQQTYRKWRRSTLIFYGVLATLITALLVAMGPPSSTSVKNNAAYSAIASARQHKAR